MSGSVNIFRGCSKMRWIMLGAIFLTGCKCGWEEKTWLVAERDSCKVYQFQTKCGKEGFFTTCRGSTEWRAGGKNEKRYENSTEILQERNNERAEK